MIQVYLTNLDPALARPGLGENRWLVIDKPVEFENNRLEFKTSEALPIILEESIVEFTSNEWSDFGRYQHVTGWIYNH